MSKSSSIILSILMTFTVLLTGCSNTPEDFSHLIENESNRIEPYPIGKSVSAQVEITTLYENPLIKETIIENDQSKMKISGLKDKEIETEINNRIDELFDKMKRYANFDEIPPYSGQAKKFDIDSKSMTKYYNVDILNNCNNILSISAHLYLSNTKNDVYLNHHEAVTLDLNTGKPIALSQLFLDNSDWQTLINDEINSYLSSIRADEESYESENYFSSNILLTKPFTGIEDTFDYRIMNHEIHLIFDHEDTEFYTADGSVIIPIQMNSLLDHLAFSERFILDDYLYENEIDNMTFFSPSQGINSSENYSEIIDGREWHTTIYSTTDNQRVQASSDLEERLVQTKVNTHIEENPEYNKFHKSHEWFEIGPYVNYRFSINLSSPEKFYWADYSFVFDESGYRLNVDDLFTDSFDYEKLLKDELKKTVLIHQIKMNEDEIQHIYDNLMFQIHTNAIYFVTPPINRDQKEFSPVNIYIQFKDIGIENLAIFD